MGLGLNEFLSFFTELVKSTCVGVELGLMPYLWLPFFPFWMSCDSSEIPKIGNLMGSTSVKNGISLYLFSFRWLVLPTVQTWVMFVNQQSSSLDTILRDSSLLWIIAVWLLLATSHRWGAGVVSPLIFRPLFSLGCAEIIHSCNSRDSQNIAALDQKKRWSYSIDS